VILQYLHNFSTNIIQKLNVVLMTEFVHVTDMGTMMCVAPGGIGAILNVGGEGGPGPPGGGRSEQLAPDSGDG
jgi:hypothetical protein